MADLLYLTLKPKNSVLNLLLFSGKELAVTVIKEVDTFVTFSFERVHQIHSDRVFICSLGRGQILQMQLNLLNVIYFTDRLTPSQNFNMQSG